MHILQRLYPNIVKHKLGKVSILLLVVRDSYFIVKMMSNFYKMHLLISRDFVYSGL